MEDIHCFIMDNLLGKDFNNIERIYDLKGSTKGRRAKLAEEEEDGQVLTGLKVLKDLNYIDFEEQLKIGKYQKDSLNYLLENDSRFLAENNLMDYSLLLIKAKTQDESKVDD